MAHRMNLEKGMEGNMKEYHRVHADINLDAIVQNCRNARKITNPSSKLMAIIKADGYGHGAVQIARRINDIVDAYGIAIVEEGIELRKAGIKKPVLILGFTPWQQYEELLDYGITQAVFSQEMAGWLSEAAIKRNRTAHIHIKIDTGMNRIGFFPTEDTIAVVKEIQKMPGIQIDGCFTHFARADEADKTAAEEQLQVFTEFTRRLKENGVPLPVCHASNSAGIIEMPQANLDMVRLGISLYGLYPSKEVGREALPLIPAMELKSYISFVKEVPAGTRVGYNGTFTTKDKTKIATIPIGYADGYPRTLSNLGCVLIKGKRAPIIGRICMDQFMVDVSGIDDVRAGETVVLVGHDGEEFLPVEEVADLAKSFNYEFLCDVGKRVPRVYYEKGKPVETRDYYA